MNTNVKSCGEALVQLLEAYGVDCVFGIPGTHTLELYRGLENSPIHHVLPRHEQGAAFMADGYARSTGKPGVCFLITGPGVTNAATAMAQAYSDSQPMLVISSTSSVSTMGKAWGEVHELNSQVDTTRPFTAFSETVRVPGDVPGLIARAFSVFRSERPRPVHIEIPIDVFGIPVQGAWEVFAHPALPAPNPDMVSQAAELLSKAERPAIILGGGALEAGAAVAKIAERLAAPILPTVAANGVVPDSHPLCLGPRFWAQSAMDVIEAADVVLALGTELSINEGCTPKPIGFPGTLIRVDIDPRKLVDRVPAQLAIWADAQQTANALAAAVNIQADDARQAEARAQVARTRQVADAGLKPLQHKHMAVTDILQECLPRDTIYATDMTQIVYTTRGTMGFEMPRRMLNPKGYGTLGYGLPAAIGAKVANPDTTVVAIAGDSGVMYTIQELATATEISSAVILVIWNNRSLAEIRDGFIGLGVKPIGVNPYTPDFATLARSMGWEAAEVGDEAGLRRALGEAQASNLATVIVVDEDGDYGSA
ncbi:MAG: 5-guanidino-2-oxopentanoate decarboxylase [Pseudomonadota bacterium]